MSVWKGHAKLKERVWKPALQAKKINHWTICYHWYSDVFCMYVPVTRDFPLLCELADGFKHFSFLIVFLPLALRQNSKHRHSSQVSLAEPRISKKPFRKKCSTCGSLLSITHCHPRVLGSFLATFAKASQAALALHKTSPWATHKGHTSMEDIEDHSRWAC